MGHEREILRILKKYASGEGLHPSTILTDYEQFILDCPNAILLIEKLWQGKKVLQSELVNVEACMIALDLVRDEQPRHDYAHRLSTITFRLKIPPRHVERAWLSGAETMANYFEQISLLYDTRDFLEHPGNTPLPVRALLKRHADLLEVTLNGAS